MGLLPRQLNRVEFSAVREAAEAQAGRLEVVRQAITVGLAGLAGVGILLFTDSGTYLNRLGMKVAAGAGVALVLSLVASIHTLTTYANYIRVLGGEAGAAPRVPHARPSRDYEAGIKIHLLMLYVLLSVAALAVLAIGYSRWFVPDRGENEAIERGRQLISLQTGISPKALQLAIVEKTGSDYVIAYAAETNLVYIVRLAAQTFDLESFVTIPAHQPLPTHQLPSADESASVVRQMNNALSNIASSTAALADTAKEIFRHDLDTTAMIRCYAAAIQSDLKKGSAAEWSERDLSDAQRRQIQASLVALHLLNPTARYPNPVDGVFGTQTRKAIVAYHKMKQIKPASDILTRQDAVDLGIQSAGGASSAAAAPADCDHAKSADSRH